MILNDKTTKENRLHEKMQNTMPPILGLTGFMKTLEMRILTDFSFHFTFITVSISSAPKLMELNVPASLDIRWYTPVIRNTRLEGTHSGHGRPVPHKEQRKSYVQASSTQVSTFYFTSKMS